MIEVAADSGVDIVLLHVFEPGSLPMFTDQPHQEVESWAREFVSRYCPVAPGTVRLQLRVGSPADQIIAVARETDAHLVALGWSQVLERGRAAIVRAALQEARLPVLLVPSRSGRRARRAGECSAGRRSRLTWVRRAPRGRVARRIPIRPASAKR